VNNAQMKGEELDIPGLAASFEHKVADILAGKLALAAQNTGAKTLALAGGVAANGLLRQTARQRAAELGAQVLLPELRYCGDNAAMIASQGYYELAAGHTAGPDLNGCATMGIEQNYPPVGI
jgi:N6-L-threonylcarbamoyladenine synthase